MPLNTNVKWSVPIAVVAACALALTGCNGDNDEPGDQGAATSQTAQEYTAERVEAFRAEMESRLAALDRQIADLRERAGALTGEAKRDLESELERIGTLRDGLAERMSAVADATGQAWDDVAAGAEAAWNDLSAAVTRAVERFGGEGAPPGGARG